MKKTMEQTNDFHKKFEVTVPLIPTADFLDLRECLLQEEVEELKTAFNNLAMAHFGRGDIKEARIEVLDALADIVVITAGTADLLNLDLATAMDRVYESNMSKLDDSGRPIINGVNGVKDTSKPLGKILKSENFKEPKLDDLV